MIYKTLNKFYKYLRIQMLPIILASLLDEEIIRYIINKGFFEFGDGIALSFCGVITAGAIYFFVDYFKILREEKLI